MPDQRLAPACADAFWAWRIRWYFLTALGLHRCAGLWMRWLQRVQKVLWCMESGSGRAYTHPVLKL